MGGLFNWPHIPNRPTAPTVITTVAAANGFILELETFGFFAMMLKVVLEL